MESGIIEEKDIKSLETKKSFINQYPFKDIVDIGSKVFALFLGLIYVCGFLILNSHFYKYGIVDLGIASSDYLVAGALFMLYITTYALFGGRAIVLGKTWMSNNINYLINQNSHKSGKTVAFVHSFVVVIFLNCLSAALFSTYAFSQFESLWFYMVLSVAFMIRYPMDVFNWDIKYPLADLIIDSIIKMIAIYVFFAYASSLKSSLIFGSFFIFSMYINLVLDSFDRYKVTKDRIIYASVYSLIFFFASAVSFGVLVYGDISKKIGGGQNIPIEIGLNADLLKDMRISGVSSLSGELIYAAENSVYINRNDKIIILPRSSVQWMEFHSTNDINIRDAIRTVLLKNDEGHQSK